MIKSLAAFLIPLSLGLTASAQEMGVKVNKIDASEDTTISIKKGRQAEEIKFEITEGSDELAGDPAPLQKEARSNWKKACDEWKKEMKELNQENKLLTLSCGSPQCSTTAMETVCKSTTKHKIKVRLN
ncbi:MAG: hypothetical protein KF865_04720 [Bdellovibrionaceae bacterium]|nr:hypothetical protein [Pseudobdellovibrionaceae bacterium]